jgi:hypothetical protein
MPDSLEVKEMERGPVTNTSRVMDLADVLLKHAKEKKRYTTTCQVKGDRFIATYNGAVLIGILMVSCPMKAESNLAIDERAKTVTATIEYNDTPDCPAKVVFVYDQ